MCLRCSMELTAPAGLASYHRALRSQPLPFLCALSSRHRLQLLTGTVGPLQAHGSVSSINSSLPWQQQCGLFIQGSLRPGRRPGAWWVLNWHVGQEESLTPEKSPSVLGAHAQVCEDARPRLRGFAGGGGRGGSLRLFAQFLDI